MILDTQHNSTPKQYPIIDSECQFTKRVGRTSANDMIPGALQNFILEAKIISLMFRQGTLTTDLYWI